MLKLVIFDFGRTLYDNDHHRFFSETESVLEYCSAKYHLALVSLVNQGTIEERQQLLRIADFERFFQLITFTAEDKDRAYEETMRHFAVESTEVAIVDDRAVRGIRWGNNHSCLTIWLRRGKFSHETLPLTETQPTYIIDSLSLLPTLL